MKQVLVELQKGKSIEELMAPVRHEWESGRFRRLLLHVYSGRDEDEFTVQVARGLQACFPQGIVVGTMAAGEVADGHILAKGVLVGALLFQETDVRMLRYDSVSGREREIGRQIREDVQAIPQVRAAELTMPGAEMSAKGILDELSLCKRDIQIFGGYAGGHTMNDPMHFIFDANSVMYDSIIVVAFAGESFHVDIDKVIGWEPLGLSFRVTKASGNQLIELDGRPASEIYEKFLQIDRSVSDNAEEGYTFPFLTRDRGETWLRSTVHIEEDGSLNLHGHAVEGMDIQLSYGNTESIVTQVNERLQAIRAFKPQVILLYSCIVRRVFWRDLVDIEMEPFARICSTAGFHTWGEIARSPLTGEVIEHNVTMLTVAMREGDAPAEEMPDVHVDDAILRGQGAQLRRLTSLIYTTMGELQKAQADLRALNEQLRVMAERDALTGLYNRGKTEQLIHEALDSSASTGRPVGLVMADVDHFKQVNDRHGHHAGDVVLKGVADQLRKAASSWDGGAAGRWGGEEFFLVLPGADGRKTLELAEQLRCDVASRVFDEVGRVTLSIGVVSVRGAVDRRHLFTHVDDALYRAKEGGRNRVEQAQV